MGKSADSKQSLSLSVESIHSYREAIPERDMSNQFSMARHTLDRTKELSVNMKSKTISDPMASLYTIPCQENSLKTACKEQ